MFDDGSDAVARLGFYGINDFAVAESQSGGELYDGFSAFPRPADWAARGRDFGGIHIFVG
ncbi:hypothetical protein IUS38_24730 [Mycobacteroides abscessus subsp. abscessus]|uniref:hypothetical protein n=1 Tax=Mycobacteroides abscessus TaxID=36809 RepID=UPI0019D01895|nr:hypothetical protein [Mycobacteroides abscessus]MBN7438791.1 hypothetical protein [Mycobacteroides abscessus subsp. abscessus]